MSNSATAAASPLSTGPRRTGRSASHALALLAIACGWHTGPPAADAGRAVVTGAALEPGLRAALESAIARDAQARGAGEIAVAIVAVDEVPVANEESVGTAAWATRVRLAVGRPDRAGCAGEISAERAWIALDPEQAVAARADAAGALAEELGRRAVDAVEAACR